MALQIGQELGSYHVNRFEIVVQQFPEARGVKFQVSKEGGVAPRWRADGRELYFIVPDSSLIAIPVLRADGSTFELERPPRSFPLGS